MRQYWFEDPELNEVLNSDSCEALRRCLLLVESEDSTERIRAAYALRLIGRNPSARGEVDQEQIYKVIFRLIERSLVAEDWEAGAAAIVSLSSLMKYLPPDKDTRSPMQLVKLCENITRPMIWQRVIQHLYYFYDHDDAIGDFLRSYIENKEVAFRDIAEATLDRIQSKR